MKNILIPLFFSLVFRTQPWSTSRVEGQMVEEYTESVLLLNKKEQFQNDSFSITFYVNISENKKGIK